MTDAAEAPTRSREHTRARLLDAAAQVFAEAGVDATSVESIVERAGFTRGAFYSNFASKHELLVAVLRHATERKLEDVEQRLAELQSDAGGERGVWAPGALVVRVIGGDDPTERMLMCEIRAHAIRDPSLAAPFLEWESELIGRVTRIVEQAAHIGGLTLRVEPAVAASLIFDIAQASAERATMAALDPDASTRAFIARISSLAEMLRA